MLRLLVLISLALILIPAPVSAQQFVAEQVTAGNASTRLFGGTDADGGIGDWYVSNGVVEAIIDDVGPQPDLFPLLGPGAPPKQSEVAVTGGSLIDLGLVGRENDQLAQLFTVGGLSTSNFILYFAISPSSTASSATITASGILLGFDSGTSPVPASNLVVVTEYTAAGADPFLAITTTVTNTHPTNTALGLGGLLDAIIWSQRAIVPFSPFPGRGFRHPILDLSNFAAALEFPSFAAGPGNVTPADGVMDPPSGTTAGEVSYGLLGVEVSIDQDGPGLNSPVVIPVNTLFGVSSNLLTAFGNIPAATGLNPGGVLTYKRRLYVGSRNDVASVANPMIAELATRQSFGTGTISGDVDATDTPDVVTSAIATKTGGPPSPGFGPNTPVTHFRTDATGAFGGIVLPEGTYDLEFRAVERDPVIVSGVTVTASANTAVVVPLMTGLGTVNLSIFGRREAPKADLNEGDGKEDQDERVPTPAKVTFKGIDGSADPKFRKDFEALAVPSVGPAVDLMPETFAGGPALRNVVYLADGTGSVQVRPGTYEVFASRGPEFTVRRRKVRVEEGETKDLKFNIRQIVDTSGFLSADFHVHSARSFDASATLRDRVASYAGEGVEVMVSTDHDYHLDYSSIIADLGLGSHITSIIGNEVTTSVPNFPAFPDAIGHINAWPLPIQAAARRDGAIEDEFVAPNFIFSRLRNQGAEVVQYNHPRAGVAGLTVIGFFNNIGYDPDLPITSPPNDILLDNDIFGPGISGIPNPNGFRNIDFDVMEIANTTSIPQYLAVRRDWLSLLNQTDFATVPFIPGTAVSDSHRLVLEEAGYFRTYVGGVGHDPTALDVTLFDDNVKAGNMIGTTGPFIEFSVEENDGGASAGLGQTLTPATSDVVLEIRVQATNWIPVEEVRVIANGFVVMTFDGTTLPAVRPAPNNPLSQGKGQVERFEAEIPVSLSADTYFIVEAGAKLDPLPSSPDFVNKIV
ncbi:MAG: CehA/McbA family metallohydrolase, partial [Gemmatimonadota bacterium]